MKSYPRQTVHSAPSNSISVVVPAHQARGDIEKCLAALRQAGFSQNEILVVDDGSCDGTGAAAQEWAGRVLRNEIAAGPAKARNRGAAEVGSDILVFVDADVVVHPGARDKILSAFAERPELSALFGSYDDDPPAPRLVSRYRNLLHHHTHQHSREEAATFWTGFGAVRREVFLAHGGFDKAWQNIEDVEFGHRVRKAGGRIRLERDLLCAHLKEWTLASMFRTDLKGRAVPWTRLIRQKGLVDDDLNLTASHRASAAMVPLFALGLLCAPLHPASLLLSAAAILGFVLSSRRFLGFLARRHGLAFAAAAVPFHAFHYLAALLGYGAVVLGDLTGLAGRSRTEDPEGSAEAHTRPVQPRRSERTSST